MVHQQHHKVTSKGFDQLGSEEVDSLSTRRNLTATVSSLYNNTEIFCRAWGSKMNTDSEIAILIVQGIHAYKIINFHSKILPEICSFFHF